MKESITVKVKWANKKEFKRRAKKLIALYGKENITMEQLMDFNFELAETRRSKLFRFCVKCFKNFLKPFNNIFKTFKLKD